MYYAEVGKVEVRRLAERVDNILGAPQSVHSLYQASKSVFNDPRGRDVLLYAERATFYDPVRYSVRQEEVVCAGIKVYAG